MLEECPLPNVTLLKVSDCTAFTKILLNGRLVSQMAFFDQLSTEGMGSDLALEQVVVKPLPDIYALPAVDNAGPPSR
jgi:hypothetical protein